MVTTLVEIGCQDPRVRSVPPYVSSLGAEAIELCASAGLILDEWQADTIEDGLGMREDGKFAAFEVGVVVPRQNGKGALLEARELAGLFLLGERLIIHSSHQFDTSMEAFLRMEELLEGCADLSRLMRKPSRAHGSEGFTTNTGQRLRYRTRTKGGGRGFTSDCLILDEAMDLPIAFHSALFPTQSGKSVTGKPQVWYTASAVDQLVHEHGVVLAKVRERGHAGDDPSLAYFEWSADVPADEDDSPVTPDSLTLEMLGDQELWAQANPGLGKRISAEHVANEMRSMDARSFAVERLNVGDWPVPNEKGWTVIGEELWLDLADADSVVLDPVCLAFSVKPDRSRAVIAVAGGRRDGLAHLEVVEDRRGTGWLVARLVELVGTHKPSGVLCEGSSAASSFERSLADEGVEVMAVPGPDRAVACGRFFDLADQRGFRHMGTPELTAAVKGARTRPLGDAWVWSRKDSLGEVSPLVACTLALHGWATVPAPSVGWRGL